MNITHYRNLKPSNKILCVDDDVHVLKALSRVLAHCGEVVMHSDPVEALREIETTDFSVIISDQRMPKMDGIELLKRARQLQPETVRILLTAYRESDLLLSAINESGVFKYLCKPWQDGALQVAVHEAKERYLSSFPMSDEYSNSGNQLAEGEPAIGGLGDPLKEANAGSVLSLAALIHGFDPLLFHHSLRVAKWCRMIIQFYLSLNRPTADAPPAVDAIDRQYPDFVHSAALLHDLGALRRSRTSPRTASLRQAIGVQQALDRFHAEEGAEVLRLVPSLEPVATVVRCLSENFDGSGGPKGLKGEHIPLPSRIIRVASDYDELVGTHRLLKNDAIKKLNAQSGRWYDPQLLPFFVSIIRRCTRERHLTETSVTELRPGMILGQDLKTHKGEVLHEKDACLEAKDLERLQDPEHRRMVAEPLYVYRTIL